jgi:hypothetical protein
MEGSHFYSSNNVEIKFDDLETPEVFCCTSVERQKKSKSFILANFIFVELRPRITFSETMIQRYLPNTNILQSFEL